MSAPNPLRREVAVLAELAIPVAITQLGYMLTGVVDMAMLGHYSTPAMNAAGLGHTWMMAFQLFAMGVLFGIDPIVSQAHGRRDAHRAGLALQQGLVLSVAAALLTALVWLFAEPGLIRFGQEPQLARLARSYVLANLPGLWPFLAFVVLRSYLQGRGIVRPAMWLALSANGVNALANWILIYGNLGAPELGLVGSGYASSISRIFLFAALAVWVVAGRLHGSGWSGWTRAAFAWKGLRRVLSLGVPTGLQLSLEVWAFMAMTLWAGHLGGDSLAAHLVVLQLASLSFMVPMGISIGATTRVGNCIGAGELERAQLASWAAFVMGAITMGTMGVLFVVFRQQLPRLFSDNVAVCAIATSILPIGAAFQVSDGTQVVGGGILRGMGRTRPAAIFNLFAYYGLGLPIGWWLAFRAGLGLRGLWWGLFIGLSAVALLVVLYVRRSGPRTMGTSSLPD